MKGKITMIEKISALRNKAIERANYYTKIDFPNLANEFTELVNILNEMEAIVKERDELKAQIQKIDQTNVKVGCIMQSYAKEGNTNEI
jgi:hypothetical protein